MGFSAGIPKYARLANQPANRTVGPYDAELALVWSLALERCLDPGVHSFPILRVHERNPGLVSWDARVRGQSVNAPVVVRLGAPARGHVHIPGADLSGLLREAEALFTAANQIRRSELLRSAFAPTPPRPGRRGFSRSLSPLAQGSWVEHPSLRCAPITFPLESIRGQPK